MRQSSESNDALDQATVAPARARRRRRGRRRLVDLFAGHEPYRGYREPEVFVDIPAGSSPAEHRQAPGRAPAWCAMAGRSARRCWLSGRARELKAGEYRFDAPMHALEVIDKIARGDVYTGCSRSARA